VTFAAANSAGAASTAVQICAATGRATFLVSPPPPPPPPLPSRVLSPTAADGVPRRDTPWRSHCRSRLRWSDWRWPGSIPHLDPPEASPSRVSQPTVTAAGRGAAAVPDATLAWAVVAVPVVEASYGFEREMCLSARTHVCVRERYDDDARGPEAP
jgi:hypothetical protein